MPEFNDAVYHVRRVEVLGNSSIHADNYFAKCVDTILMAANSFLPHLTDKR